MVIKGEIIHSLRPKCFSKIDFVFVCWFGFSCSSGYWMFWKWLHPSSTLINSGSLFRWSSPLAFPSSSVSRVLYGVANSSLLIDVHNFFHVMCSSFHSYHCALGSPQTSPCFLRSRPRWRFRSFATMSLMNPFLAFPMIIKKTLAASPTFNLTHWTLNRKQATRQHYATEGTFWI